MKKGIKTIYISGAGGIGNIGAEAIMLSIIELFQRRCKDIRLILSTFHTKRIRKILANVKGNFKIIRNRTPFPNPLELLKADLFVVCGDMAISESVLTFLPFYWAIHTLIAKALGRKTLFLGIEAERIKRGINKFALKHIIDKTTDYFILRNSESLANLRDIPLKGPSLLLGCEPTLTLSDHSDHFSYHNHKISSSKLLVGFSVRDFFSTPLKFNLFKMKLERRDVPKSGISEEMERIMHFTAKIADYLIERHNAQPIFIPHHYLEKKAKVILTDTEIAEMITKRMKNQKGVLVVENNLHPFTVLSLYKRLDMVLSMRYHANSFASLYGIPCIGYEISEKMTNFFKHLDSEDMLVDPFSENLNSAIALIDYTIRERERLSVKLKMGLDSLQRDMQRALDTVFMDN